MFACFLFVRIKQSIILNHSINHHINIMNQYNTLVVVSVLEFSSLHHPYSSQELQVYSLQLSLNSLTSFSYLSLFLQFSKSLLNTITILLSLLLHSRQSHQTTQMNLYHISLSLLLWKVIQLSYFFIHYSISYIYSGLGCFTIHNTT